MRPRQTKGRTVRGAWLHAGLVSPRKDHEGVAQPGHARLRSSGSLNCTYLWNAPTSLPSLPPSSSSAPPGLSPSLTTRRVGGTMAYLHSASHERRIHHING